MWQQCNHSLKLFTHTASLCPWRPPEASAVQNAYSGCICYLYSPIQHKVWYLRDHCLSQYLPSQIDLVGLVHSGFHRLNNAICLAPRSVLSRQSCLPSGIRFPPKFEQFLPSWYFKGLEIPGLLSRPLAKVTNAPFLLYCSPLGLFSLPSLFLCFLLLLCLLYCTLFRSQVVCIIGVRQPINIY